MKTPIIENDKKLKLRGTNENYNLLLEFIENNPEKFKSSNSTTLSQSLKISQPTITRFSKHLGFKNFRELQIYVAERITKINAINRLVKKGDDLNSGDIISNIFNLYNYSIKETNDLYCFNHNKIVKYTKTVLENYPNIIFGIGDSAIVGRYFAKQVRKVGVPIYCVDSIHEFFSSEITLKNKAHITLISNSLKTAEILKVIEHLEKLNLTYSIWTSDMERARKICHKATNILEIVALEEEYRLVPVGIKVSCFMLVDIIFAMIINSHKEKAAKYVTMRQNIEDWNTMMRGECKHSFKQRKREKK
ncbi:MurR/RpiR family transcriptional regulator [Mycoplasma hafezii]|uniref:MurR/RpiR family transcriptional regulator n=1 Tax=Mycoplasma hafezii TaxID=525886 RepID=UPI003CE90891